MIHQVVALRPETDGEKPRRADCVDVSQSKFSRPYRSHGLADDCAALSCGLRPWTERPDREPSSSQRTEVMGSFRLSRGGNPGRSKQRLSSD